MLVATLKLSGVESPDRPTIILTFFVGDGRPELRLDNRHGQPKHFGVSTKDGKGVVLSPMIHTVLHSKKGRPGCSVDLPPSNFPSWKVSDPVPNQG